MIRRYHQLFPEKDGIFHQDSAPSHTGKKTIEFLRSQNIKFLTPEQWVPNSPDAAPCDYFLWGYLHNRINKRKISTLLGLKRCITEELHRIPQDMIDRSLKTWPSKVRHIYYNHGGHIEN